jgi:BirA family biotin operon repressor/biotin-[acetyl-CoA-carboxylase] ligase
MDVTTLRSRLAGLPIPELRYADVTGSTNDEALRWASEGAPDGALVAADQQNSGRGRFNRRWITRPGSALAFSLILIPTPEEQQFMTRFSPLGAIAICQALEEMLGLKPQIKWPNDVLLDRRKAVGILVEAASQGDGFLGVVLGIGINVSPASVPPDEEVMFPATSVEQAAGRAVDRWDLLRAILENIFHWRKQLAGEAFQQAWNDRLAFRGQWVIVREAAGAGNPITGEVIGLDPDGNLLLRTTKGEMIPVQVGDVHLRPAD